MGIQSLRWYRNAFALMLIVICFTTKSICLSEITKRQKVTVPESPMSGHERPPGPHGTLVRPQGGKLVTSVGKMGALYVDYTKCDDEDEDGATTISIDVVLRPAEENEGYSITLARGLTSPSDEPNIVALFSSKLACGSYRLVIRENQFYRGELFSFQAAAPLVHFRCIPIE